MDAPKGYPSNFFVGVKNIYKLGGLNFPAKNESRATKIFYLFYNVITITWVQILFGPAEYIILYYTYNKLDKLVQHIGLLASHTSGYAKYFLVLWRMKQIKNIMKELENDELKYEDYNDFRPGAIMTRYMEQSNSACLVLFVLGTMAPGIKHIYATYFLIFHGQMVEQKNVTCYEILPFWAWYPYEQESLIGCSLSFIFQVVPTIFWIYTIMTGDCTIASFCINFKAQFLIIKNAYSTCYQRSLQRLKLPEDYELLQIKDNPNLQKELKKEVRKVSVHLQTVIRLVSEVEEFCNLIVLSQILTSMIVIVSCLYMISNGTISLGTIGDLDHLTCGIVELYIYCYFGNELKETAKSVLEGIYDAQWFSFDREEKSTLVISMMRLQQPIVLTTGKVAELSLATFVQVMKGSYTYYTFLSTTHND